MLTTPIRSLGFAFAVGLLTAGGLLATAPQARAQLVAVLVNGEPITELDIATRTKFIRMSTNKTPTRKEVIDELINEILEVREGKRYGIEPPDSDVNNSYAGIARRMGRTSEQLTQILEHNGASADTLKRRLRAELVWTALVRGRFKASLEIRDRDVENALAKEKPDEKGEVGYEYVLRPVIFIAQRGAPEAVLEAKKKDADALRARFQNCNDGIPFARALNEVAVRDQVTRFSADLPPQLREILDGTPEGHLTPPEVTQEGVQMFALCSKKETTSDTPEKRKIKEQMFQQKFGAHAKRYLAELRRQAMIEYRQQSQ
jgi:peptidyl-prolyl cis-trans isomerase SurA